MEANRAERISLQKAEERALLIKKLPLGENLFTLNKEREYSSELLGRIPLVVAWLEYANEHDLERLPPSELLLEKELDFLYTLEPDRPLSFMRSAFFALSARENDWLEYLVKDLPGDFLQEFFYRIGASEVVLRVAQSNSFFVVTAEDIALFYKHLYLNYSPIVDWLRTQYREEGRDSFILNNSLIEAEKRQASCYAEIFQNREDTLLLVSLTEK